MPITDEMLAAISSALGSSIIPSLNSTSATSDVFEAYVLSIILRAAHTEGAQIEYRDPRDRPTSRFVFRTSPGYLWSTTQPYTFALIEFPAVERLEAHVGVRVSGKSGVLHELDVCVIRRSEAVTSRQNLVHPRSSKILIGVECKFYAAAVSLGLARSFIGLGTDVTAKNTYFLTNTASPQAERLLTGRERRWGHLIHPTSVVEVERIRNAFQSAFKYFKAR